MYVVGALAIKDAAARDAYKRRFRMYQDILHENWLIQEFLQEGREEGVQGLREVIVGLVQARFPELAALAQQAVTTLTDMKRLQDLAMSVGIAATSAEVQRHLREATSSPNGH